tara:strand:+ start:188 stop:493 length:306 start_codon:yes stop_codon:yes gene_type:complete
MSKPKKITYKELASRIDFMIEKLIQLERGLDYVHSLAISYIECNDHQEKLKEFLKKESKDEQADGSSPETDRGDKSGDKSSSEQSDESGKSIDEECCKAKT